MKARKKEESKQTKISTDWREAQVGVGADGGMGLREPFVGA